MTDLLDQRLAGSAETWREGAVPPRVPDSLRVDRSLPAPERLARWKQRHHERAEHARTVFADSRSPERGLPVARSRKAFVFVGELLRTRRRALAAMIGFNVLAAAAALVVPRMIGDLVDEATAGASLAQTDTVLLVPFFEKNRRSRNIAFQKIGKASKETSTYWGRQPNDRAIRNEPSMR